MPGPKGDRRGGKILLIAHHPLKPRPHPTVRQYRELLEKSLGMEILRRYAGVTGV